MAFIAQADIEKARDLMEANNFKEAMTEQVDKIVQTLISIGERHNKTPAQVAIAWILDHKNVTPILGADLPDHVDEIFGALDYKLDSDERAILDEVSHPKVTRKSLNC